LQIQHNPKITKPRHCWLAGLLPSFLPVQLQTTWLGSWFWYSLRFEGTENRKHSKSWRAAFQARTLEALMRSNEDGHGVHAEAVIALFAVHAISPGFFIGDISPKTETQNSRIKRVVLGLGFSVAGNEKTKKLFKKSPDFFTWFSDCSQKKKRKEKKKEG
jgi:hypothetical protein